MIAFCLAVISAVLAFGVGMLGAYLRRITYALEARNAKDGIDYLVRRR